MKYMAENIENNQEQLDENHLISIRKENYKKICKKRNSKCIEK